MSFGEALAAASRDESFKATVYAMNTLLISKGVYRQKEFQVVGLKNFDETRLRPSEKMSTSFRHSLAGWVLAIWRLNTVHS
jgi:hypothetical protein